MNFKKYKPIIVTQDSLDQKISAAVDEAVHEMRTWNITTDLTSKNDPFALLKSGLDTSFIYTPENGNATLPLAEVFLRPAFAKDSARKILKGMSKVLEAFTGGWMSIGGSGSQQGSIAGREISPEHLFLAQDAAVIKTRSDPHASGIVKNLQYYTLGQEVTWNCPSTEITSWLHQFRKLNKMNSRERNFVREIFQEGEYFSAFFVDPGTGLVKMRKFRPKEITDIETDPDDMETRLAYHRQALYNHSDKWYPDIHYDFQLKNFGGTSSEFSLEKNVFVQFSKYGASDDVRGWPPMYAALRYLKYLEDFIIDRARLHHERAKVVWFQQRKGAATRRQSGALNPLIAPKGGSMWVEDDTVSYRTQSLDLSSGDAEKDALLIIYAVASAVCMPMHVWNQRSDQQVYASIRSADTPFSQSISANQTFLNEEWEERDQFIVRKGVEFGPLPEEVRIVVHDDDLVIRTLQRINEMVVDHYDEDRIIAEAKQILAPGMKRSSEPTVEVPIHRHFPDVVREAPLDLAKTILIHQRLGIVSNSTLAARAGYNWHEELLHMINETKQKAAMEAMEESEKKEQRKKYGLKDPVPPQFDKKDNPDGGREPGAGAGEYRTSKDKLGDDNSE